jgi:alpha-glucosidase
MKYAGFIRPVWTWLRDEGSAPSFLGSPLVVPRLAGSSVM